MECQLQMHEVVQKFVSTPLFCFQDLKLCTKDIIAVLKDTLNTTLGLLPIPNPHATWVPSNTLEKHLIGSLIVDGVHDLVTSSSMVKLVGFPTFNSTFTYQKGAKKTSLMDLLLNKGVVNSHCLHKVSHSFPKVVPNEKTSIATRIVIVNNTELTIQVGGHTPRMVLLDIGAQPMMLGIQFAKKMGMFDSKLRKSMWQIYTANGSVEEDLGRAQILLQLISMKAQIKSFACRLDVQSPMPPVTMCSLGKRPSFHQVSQLTTSSNMRTIEWIGRLMATIWDTYPLI
jgi:hypothetical protein